MFNIETYISRKRFPEQYIDWIPSVLLGMLGLYLLHVHLWYLDHLNPAQWTSRYLLPDDRNVTFMIMLPRIKALIFALWAATVLFCIYGSQRLLRARHYRPDPHIARRLLAAGALFCLSVVTYAPPTIELAPYFFINSLAYALLAYAFFNMPYVERLCIGAGSGLAWLLRLRGAYWCAAAFMAMAATSDYLSWLLFKHFPLNSDTVAQFVHAKILLTGHWYADSPRLPEFFAMFEMVNNGKWFSQYPPGHVIMLAIGTALGHAELVNPVLGACTGVAIYMLARELYGAHVARIAVLLSALCTYLLYLSSEYMMNATTLLLCTLFLWSYFRVLHRPDWRYALPGGIALGYGFITRPYTIIAFALPAALYALYLLARRREYTKPMLVMAAAFVPFAAFLLYYNAITTGDPLVFGYQLVWGDKHNPLTAEGTKRILSLSIQWKNFLINLQRINMLNRVLFEWPVPSLFLVVLAFGWRGHRRDERLLFATILSVFLGCQMLPGNVEYEWGPRLVYEITGILIVLSAKSLATLPAFLRTLSARRRPLAFYYGAGLIVAASFYGFAFQHNLKAQTISNIYRFYYGTSNPELYDYITANVETPALVFVPEYWQYVAVSFTNPPDDHNPIIFARDLNLHNPDLMHLYPNRHAYRATMTPTGPNIVTLP